MYFNNFYFNVKLIDSNAKLPTRGTDGSAGLDVYSPKDYTILPRKDALIPLGFKVEFPKNYVMIFKEKSGIAIKEKLCIGGAVVDSDYRGVPHVHLFNHSDNIVYIKKNQKIAQFIVVPAWHGEVFEVDYINKNTERGSGGFGSTGK